MIRVLYLIFFILLIFSCSEKVPLGKEEINLGINFNTSSTIILHYKNAQDSISLETSFYNFFPSNYIEDETNLTNKNGKKLFTFKIQHPQKIDLNYGELAASFFLVPDDTLEIYINLDPTQNIKKDVKFVGKYAAINSFYKNKELHFNKTDAEFNYSKAMAFNSQNTIAEYSAIMDSLTQLELDYLNNYKQKKSLPNWFIDYELTDIKCGTSESKLMAVVYRRDFLKQSISLPENYFSDIKTFMANCPNSILPSSYFHYLRINIQLKYKRSFDTLNQKTAIEAHEFFINESIKTLPQKTSDIFLTKSLEIIIETNTLNDTVYSLYYNAIQNQEFKTYLDDRKKEKGEFLKQGENAPPFMLPDFNENKIQLKDFKGNIIYLSFWFTGCKPCLKEFPDENELVGKFKGKKVKIINVCTLSSIESWKYISKKYKLKMINLYANDTLDNFIEKNYGITGYPHHVLIDKEGKIIQNKCARADKIEDEINELLKND